MVFAYHLRWIGGEPILMLAGIDWQPILRHLDLGVCLFFVLSGYLLSGPFWDGMALGAMPNVERYAVRRLSRIYPAYLSALIVTTLLLPGYFTFWGLISVLLQLAGVHTFADYAYLGSVPVLWSIGIEIQFYVLLPIMFSGVMAVTRRRWFAILGLTALMLCANQLWQAVGGMLLGIVPARILPSEDSPVLTRSVFHYLKWFWVGIIMSYLVKYPCSKIGCAFWDIFWICSIIGLTFTVMYSNEGEWRQISGLGWPFSACCCGLLVASTPRSRIGIFILNRSLLRWIGIISYGVYIWHWPILKAVFSGTFPNYFGYQWGFVVCGAIALTGTCLASWLSYISIERPAIMWARKQEGVRDALHNLWRWLVFHDEPKLPKSYP